MSEIKTDKLTGVGTAGSIVVTGEGNSTTTNLQQGLCKSWATIIGTGTPTINDSLNMTSVTDNSTGNFTFNIANDMNNAEYASSYSVYPTTTTSPAIHSIEIDCTSSPSPILAGSLRVEVAYSTTSTSRTELDPTRCSVKIHGDLA